jgi:hypothetical protein
MLVMSVMIWHVVYGTINVDVMLARDISFTY